MLMRNGLPQSPPIKYAKFCGRHILVHCLNINQYSIKFYCKKCLNFWHCWTISSNTNVYKVRLTFSLTFLWLLIILNKFWLIEWHNSKLFTITARSLYFWSKLSGPQWHHIGQVTKVGLSCYLVLIAKPGNKTAPPSWPDQYGFMKLDHHWLR